MKEEIYVKGVKVHNLKDVSLKLPLNKLIVFTGVSGSGKSSLAFDTLFVEGQRRYIESLSTYARRYLGDLAKPDAEALIGIPPTIAIEQKSAGKNPRSTVGTLTAIYDYLRVLYARLGVPHCPISHERVSPVSREEIAATILKKEEKQKIIILAPFAKSKKGEFKEEFADLIKRGFLRVRVDCNYYHLENDELNLEKNIAHTVDIVVDRISVTKENKGRIFEAIEMALEVGKGVISVIDVEKDEELLFSEHAYSPKSGKYYSPLTPENFSFNHPQGMCEKCHGLGEIRDFDLDLIIDKELSISENCCQIAGSYDTVKWGNIYNNLAKLFGFKVTTPWKNLTDEAKNVFLYGTEEKWTKMVFVHPVSGKRWTDFVAWRGVIPEAKRRLSEATSDIYRNKMSDLMKKGACPTCKGSRIQNYPAATTFFGKKIHELTEMTIEETHDFLADISLEGNDAIIGDEILRELTMRLKFLLDVGLSYLTLARTAPTLSGGEAQRTRLASQIGYGLVGTLYILDEPSIGLHPSDNRLLIKTLHALKDRGNSVIVVEHDEETILSADLIVDIGPQAGIHGGEVVAMGSIDQITKEKRSITGRYLSGDLEIEIPEKRRPYQKEAVIKLKGASHHNLRAIDAEFPLGLLTVVTGISGSGKSSLVTDTLYPALANQLNKAKMDVGAFEEIDGLTMVDKVIAIDQSPIGRTPRSNPATYIKVFDDIRELFASLPESQAMGYLPGRFSFNVREGSCYNCRGFGSITIDMDFMEDEIITCPHCQGKRFDPKTLEIKFKGKNIYDILEMDLEEALELFEDFPHINRKLSFLVDVGLGYIKLGQSSTTLSGGEAQRIKLGKELSKPRHGKTLYILDEPTTGLHFHDIQKLIHILQKLVDKGNTVIVIEHNIDLIKTADWIIDLGPGGGKHGGQIIAAGTPEIVAKSKSPTAPFVKEALERKQLELVKTTIETETKELEKVSVVGARQNNLKNVSLDIPRGSITVFTGPSGSGKSSLAFETIYQEGRARYFESLSGYARKMLGQQAKPNVEKIEGLSPAIAIEQKKHAGNPRSTLGTMTEVYDYLRIVFARLGTPYCPDTGEEIKAITPKYVADKLKSYPEKTKLMVLAPLEVKRSEPFEHLLTRLQKQGHIRIRINNEVYRLEDKIPFDPNLKNEVALVVDRIIVKKGGEGRILEALEHASMIGQRKVIINDGVKDYFYNLDFAVESTGKSYPAVTHQTFSFNREEGMCQDCLGLGFRYGITLKNDKSILKFTLADLFERLLKDLITRDNFNFLKAIFKQKNIPFEEPIKSLEKEQINFIFDGSEEILTVDKLSFSWIGLHQTFFRIAKMSKPHIRDEIIPFMAKSTCPSCEGSRLNPLARNVKIGKVTLPDLCKMPLSDALTFSQKLDSTKLKDALTTLINKLSFLCEIGLEYLSLDRYARTLSGGEVQRTRLATQLGSYLRGVLFVLDEPTIALHPHNNYLLNQALDKLKKLGNTLILVEHDPMTIEHADYIVDFGPGSGIHGGQITAKGSVKEIKKDPNSLTGAYLSGKKMVSMPEKRRKIDDRVVVENISIHNIKDVTIEFPKRAMTVISGVSGSGKSSLLYDALLPGLEHNANKRKPANQFEHNKIKFSSAGDFDKVISIDQSPMGRTNRSDIATYTDLLTPLRRFYASLPEAKIKGLMPKNFSYNHVAGMCKKCRGLGKINVDLEFLGKAEVICDTCHGEKLNPISSRITYRGKSLGKLLELSVSSARNFLPPIPKIERILDRLIAVGLDYVKLGQETATLSGGESGRLKLSSELSRTTKEHTLYIFDEPTTGLHMDDVNKLIPIFHSLVNKKGTLIIIEHNLDVIANADYVIDMGPGAGIHGGKVIATGRPEDIASSKDSYTGKYLEKTFQLAAK